MVTVKVNTAGDQAQLTLQGHAGYNPGNDIVCAGASAVVTALACWLQNSRHWLREEPVVKLLPGDVLLQARGGVEMMEAYRVATAGLQCLAASYPGHVQVVFQNP
jgi:uncharacterized protein YsxB (DUF464 family)